jgi:hypothetical protein
MLVIVLKPEIIMIWGILTNRDLFHIEICHTKKHKRQIAMWIVSFAFLSYNDTIYVRFVFFVSLCIYNLVNIHKFISYFF